MQKSSYIGLGLLVAVLLVLPWVVPNSYYMDLAIRIGINAIIVIGLNLLIGLRARSVWAMRGFWGLALTLRRCCLRTLHGIRCWR